MDQPQETRFYGLAVTSGLMTPAQFAACWEALPEAKRTPDAVDRRLARLAVELGYLTRWQAQQLLSGTKPASFFFDKYVVQALIGQGGMGRVFLAKDQRLGRRVALKVLSRDRVNNPRARARFQREARLGAQLQHDNLVRIYDQGEAGGLIYLVMEYIDGKTVGSIVADRGPLPPALAVRVVYQVALGLQHAHLKGLVHRDVNPQNILIARDGTAKLTDLGLALDLGDQGDAVTREGATVGTFDYISPEQARSSRAIDIRSDIYSLGCSFYHVLAGRVPFPQPSLPEKLYAHQALEPDPITTLSPTVPPQVAAVLHRMMAKEAEDRYATPGEVAAALEPYLGPAVCLVDFESAPEEPVWLDPATATGTGTASSGTDTPPESGPAGAGGPGDRFVDLVAGPGGSGVFIALESSGSGVHRAEAPAPTPRHVGEGPGPELRRVVAAASAFGLGVLVLWYALSRGAGGGGASPGPGGVGGVGGGMASVPHGPLVLVKPAPDAEPTPQPDLQSAVTRAAAREGAEVVLRDYAAIELPLDRSVVVASGRAVIAAAAGSRPTLHLPDRGGAPAFLVKPGATLVLRGLTVLGNPSEARSGALVQNDGGVILEHCTILLGPNARDLALVAGQGASCTIRHCDVRGADSPLRLDLHAGATVELENCLFVAPAGGPPRWALAARAVSAGGAAEGRRVAVTGSTFVNLGLLGLESATDRTALGVAVKGAVVQAPALLGWGGNGPFTKGIRWQGEGNRFAITGPAWVVTPDGSALDMAPGSLDAWRGAATEAESSRALATPPFAADAADLAAAGFALPAADGPAGFDPARLGAGR